MQHSNKLCYSVDFGAHGSPGKAPSKYILTLEEAEAQAAEWRALASTIGGTAEIHEKFVENK